MADLLDRSFSPSLSAARNFNCPIKFLFSPDPRCLDSASIELDMACMLSREAKKVLLWLLWAAAKLIAFLFALGSSVQGSTTRSGLQEAMILPVAVPSLFVLKPLMWSLWRCVATTA